MSRRWISDRNHVRMNPTTSHSPSHPLHLELREVLGLLPHLIRQLRCHAFGGRGSPLGRGSS